LIVAHPFGVWTNSPPESLEPAHPQHRLAHWRGWLKPENRCLVPVNSFAEYPPQITVAGCRSYPVVGAAKRARGEFTIAVKSARGRGKRL
jgi:hypothetical protein